MQATIPSYNFHVYKRQRADGKEAKGAMSIARYAKKGHDMGFDYSTPSDRALQDAIEWATGLDGDTGTDEEVERVQALVDAMRAEIDRNYTIQWAVVKQGEHVLLLEVMADDNVGDKNDLYGRYEKWYEPGAIMTEHEHDRRREWRPRVRKPRRIQPRRKPQEYESAYGRWDGDHTLEWFIPEWSLKERHAHYIRQGYHRHEAWLKALADARRDEERAHGERMGYYYLSVTAFDMDGNEVGVAGCGGVDIDDDYPEEAVFAEIFEDEIPEALP